MSRHHFERTVRQSLLDRLIDDGTARSDAASWDESVVALKRSVMRDLQWLLNARRVSPAAPPALDLVCASIYNFGLRDLSSRSAQSSAARSELKREVEDAITTFEPRLTNIRVTLVEGTRDVGGSLIRFHIEATLRTDPTPVDVGFETTLDVASKAVVVTESIDA